MDDFTILKPGQRLRAIRKKLGLTQEDLVGKNMSKNYISMFENGKRPISIINATYLAETLNNKAKDMDIELNLTASYFVKSEKDLARERCLDWLDNIKKENKNNKIRIYRDLYNIIYLSNRYGLEDILAEALEKKGKLLYTDRLYPCSITHLSQSLLYYCKEDNKKKMKSIYVLIGKAYFMDLNYKMSIVYYNLAGLMGKDENILYYKALSYYKLGHSQIALNIIDNIMFRDERVLKLIHNIENNY